MTGILFICRIKDRYNQVKWNEWLLLIYDKIWIQIKKQVIFFMKSKNKINNVILICEIKITDIKHWFIFSSWIYKTQKHNRVNKTLAGYDISRWVIKNNKMNTAQIIKSSEYTGHRKGNPVHHLFSYCMNTRGATADFIAANRHASRTQRRVTSAWATRTTPVSVFKMKGMVAVTVARTGIHPWR